MQFNMQTETLTINCKHLTQLCVMTHLTQGYFIFQIEVGSTNIRVGSTIFGTREYPNTPSPSPEKRPEVTEVSEEAAKTMEHLTVKEH